MALQEALVPVAGKLASAVTVQDHRLPRLSLPKRHQHGLQHQLTIPATAHRPADNDVGVQVDDDTQVKPQAADDTDVGIGLRYLPPCLGASGSGVASSVREHLRRRKLPL